MAVGNLNEILMFQPLWVPPHLGILRSHSNGERDDGQTVVGVDVSWDDYFLCLPHLPPQVQVMTKTYRNQPIVDLDVSKTLKRVDLLVDDENDKYVVDWYFEYQIEHIEGNLYRFVPDEVLKKLVDENSV